MNLKEKYDRQIRLWGVEGQKEIQNSIIFCLGSDVIATEFLKNLVLHAVGNIVIVDDAIVTEFDVGINFFVENSFIGQKRAEVVCKLLHEMNPDPSIEFIIKNPFDLSVLEDSRCNKSAIIVTTGNISNKILNEISNIVRSKNIRQIHIQTLGFFGAFYIDGNQHHFYEGGVENKDPNDLRIHKPFPELLEYFESFNLDSLEDIEHAHLPYPIILYHARKRLLNKEGINKISSLNKKLLIEEIKLMMRSDDEQSCLDAIENCSLAYDIQYPPINISEAFQICDQFNENDSFWNVIKECRKFYELNGFIPHHGNIPDIESYPKYFKKLKEIYRNKSENDWNQIKNNCKNIDINIINRLQKNLWRSGGILYKSIKELIQIEPNINLIFDENSKYLAIIQNLFICIREFKELFNREIKIDDENELLNLMKNHNYNNIEEIIPFIEEICKYEGNVYPSVAATLSSLAAQEITKLIIYQASPIKGFLIYDAIHQIMNTGE